MDKFEHVNPLEFLHSGIVSSSIVNDVDGAVEAHPRAPRPRPIPLLARARALARGA